MVTDYEVYAKTLCIFNLFYGFNATVEYNNQFYTRLVSVVNALFANPVTFLVTVGDIESDIGSKLL